MGNRVEIGDYPLTHRGDVVDNYFSVEVADPYRWLEDDASEQTTEWVNSQIEFTEKYLSQLTHREAIKSRLTELWDYPTQSAPSKHGDYYYFSYNSGLENQASIYRKKELDAEWELFLDPNTLSQDGTSALSSISFSKDGLYCAYGVSEAGSDWVQIRVINCQSGELLEDKIDWIKFSKAIWSPDNKGFYYSAYDAPVEGVFSTQNQFHKVYYHTLGTAQSDDKLIYSDHKNPLSYFFAEVSRDGEWEFITASQGTSGSEILYRRAGKGVFKTLLKGFEWDYEIVDCRKNQLLIHTNNSAENYRLISIDLSAPSQIIELIPQSEESAMESCVTAGDYIFATYLQDATSRVYQYRLNGELIRQVELPSMGTVTGFEDREEAQKVYYSVSSFTSPATIYSFDLKSGESELYLAPEVKFNPDDFTTEQIFYTSADGTRVPMFVSYKKGLKLNGENLCYLYGYGGFQINLTPQFNTSAVMLMEAGGVYCVANLRGGAEYGEAWHKGGMRESKQNVFDDFIAAAEYLIENRYTSSHKLAIAGGSNGGLLVGAVMTQRPELFAVALPAVGVLDMLRYHKFTIGWGWAVEYGSSEDEAEFKYLYAYSPLHNLRDGVEYPATLITTADHDDRVVPAHSFKFAAQLQHSNCGSSPMLIRIERDAGHGLGKPTSKRIAEAADVYSFIFENSKTKYNY
ncbi:MAG: prolyl oligopeptidase family serine peptidase [Rikenellaceae bacterium]